PGRARVLGGYLKTSLLAAAILMPAAAAAQIPSLPTVTTTGTPRSIPLDEAVRVAESQSAQIRIARAGVQRAQGQQYQARSLGFGAKNQHNVRLAFAQNLSAGGRISGQNQAANAGRKSADIELMAQRAQLRRDVTQAYFDAALADRLVALAESSAVQTENVLRQTQLARNVGNVSEFELLRAQVSSANQRPIVIQRQSDREVAYLRLKQLLNFSLDAPVELTTVVDDSAATNAALASIG